MAILRYQLRKHGIQLKYRNIEGFFFFSRGCSRTEKLKEKERRREGIQSGGCYPDWGEEEERKEKGAYLAVGRWEKNKCEWGDTRSGELHKHTIREERERGSRRHQRAEGGIWACDLV